MSDYISREEVLKNKIVWYHNDGVELIEDTAVPVSYIEHLPSADVRENIHGEWIPKERATECSIDIDIVCSRCGFVGVERYAHGYELNEINIQKVRDYIKELDMNFCTCCGAKMKGEKEKKKFLCEWNIRAEIEAKSDIEAKRTFAEKLSNDFFTSVYPEDVKIVRGEEA